MAQLTQNCKVCDKPIKIKAETYLPGLGGYCIEYFCGHVIFSPTKTEKLDPTIAQGLKRVILLDPTSQKVLNPEFQALNNSGHAAHLYQIEGLEFAERANFRCVIGDEVGVGKTLQAILMLKEHPELMPAIILQKSATTYNWCKELQNWAFPDNSKLLMPILSREHIFPGIDIMVMSHDLLATGNKDKNGSTIDRLLKCGIKTIIVDEAHCFKSQTSNRNKALITLITRGEIQNRIFLTGTAIVNRATEYFTMLNLCDPVRFSNFAHFCRTWLIPNEKGVYSRIKPWKLQEFHDLTKPYILRRTRKEVLKNLPQFNHETESLYIDDPVFKNLYNKELDLFSNFLNSAQKMNSTEILGWLARIRNITGMAKIGPITELASDFLDSTEDPDEKLIIGIHHQGVRQILAGNLRAEFPDLEILELDGSHGPIEKNQIVDKFKTSKKARVLICNVLAGGIGLNLQFCHNIWLMERQWSPTHEKQFWGRVDRQGQTEQIFAKTFNARGTIDSWLDDLIQTKAGIIGETLNDNDFAFDGGTLREFADTVIAGRLK